MENMRDAYIDVTFQPEAKIRTLREVYQYDYGVALRIDGLQTKHVLEIHFAHDGQREADVVVPEYVDGFVIAEVPKKQLEQKKDIHCYLYLEDDDSGYTVYEIKLPVRTRIKPARTNYSEDEVDNYDRLIAHLNSVIDEVEDFKEEVAAEVDEIQNMKVVAETLPHTEEATADWDAESKTLKLGIPKGEPGSGGGSEYSQPIDDTQASPVHPWSGYKIQQELDAIAEDIRETDDEFDEMQQEMASIQEQLEPLITPPEDSASLAGKILGYDENGNLVPMDPPETEGEVTAVDDGNGNVVLTSLTSDMTVTDDGAGNVVQGG